MMFICVGRLITIKGRRKLFLLHQFIPCLTEVIERPLLSNPYSDDSTSNCFVSSCSNLSILNLIWHLPLIILSELSYRFYEQYFVGIDAFLYF